MVKKLLDFLNSSPVNFLAAKNIASYLEQAESRFRSLGITNINTMQGDVGAMVYFRARKK